MKYELRDPMLVEFVVETYGDKGSSCRLTNFASSLGRRPKQPNNRVLVVITTTPGQTGVT